MARAVVTALRGGDSSNTPYIIILHLERTQLALVGRQTLLMAVEADEATEAESRSLLEYLCFRTDPTELLTIPTISLGCSIESLPCR